MPLGGNEFGKYWRSGQTVRCKAAFKVGNDDVLAENDRAISVNKYLIGGGNYETSGTIIENKMPIKCDAWSYGLITFYGAEKYRVSFDELLNQPHKIHSAQMRQEDGRELAYVDVSHNRARLEISFDPKVNWLVRKMKMETVGPEEKRERTESRVLSFKEIAPGVFFPERVDTRGESVDRSASMSVTFSNIQVNQPLPDDLFRLRFPPGIIVSDLIQNKISKTDANGEPILQATNSRGKPLHLSKASPIPRTLEGKETYRVTQEEPRSWTRWLLPSSLTFLIVDPENWTTS